MSKIWPPWAREQNRLKMYQLPYIKDMATRGPGNKIDLKCTNYIKDMATRGPGNKIDLKCTNYIKDVATRGPWNKINLKFMKRLFWKKWPLGGVTFLFFYLLVCPALVITEGVLLNKSGVGCKRRVCSKIKGGWLRVCLCMRLGEWRVASCMRLRKGVFGGWLRVLAYVQVLNTAFVEYAILYTVRTVCVISMKKTSPEKRC